MKTKTLVKIKNQRVSKLTLNELKHLKGGADLRKFAEDLVNEPPNNLLIKSDKNLSLLIIIHFKTVRPQRNLNRQLGLIEFNDECLDITKRGKLFFYTDGYHDQISDTKRMKLGKSEYIKLLSKTIDKPVEEQVKHLELFLERWKGNYEQVDDILVLGIDI